MNKKNEKYNSAIKASSREIILECVNEYNIDTNNKSYHTMAAELDKTNNDSELGFLLKNNIIQSPSQFYGVNKDESIIQHNKDEYPEANHICLVMEDYLNYPAEVAKNAFCVNIDTTYEAENAIKFFGGPIDNLFEKNADLLILLNFIIKNPRNGKEYTLDEIRKYLWTYLSEDCINNYMRKAITYENSRTTMCTIAFCRERENTGKKIHRYYRTLRKFDIKTSN